MNNYFHIVSVAVKVAFLTVQHALQGQKSHAASQLDPTDRQQRIL